VTEAQRKELNPPPCSAVLDACCGSRMMWVDKRDERVTFVDRRNEYYEIKPDRAYPNGTVIRVRTRRSPLLFLKILIGSTAHFDPDITLPLVNK
jgi:hypothetical protein